MRRNWDGFGIWVVGVCAVSAFSLRAGAQEGMAAMGATMGMSNTLDGAGGGMSTSASQYTRGLPSNMSSLGSPGAGDALGGNFGATPGGASSAMGGSGGAPGGVGMTAPIVVTQPFHWNNMRGADFVRELQQRGTNKRTYRRPALRRAPYRRPVAKYPLAPRGWLSYYLQQDRYKFATRVWNFVSIEDDSGRYPVRYYYRPNSPTMLALLTASPSGVRRYNRVIGFKSWRDAMIAGLRPDPVSKPEPAARVLQLASLSRSDATMRYIEAAYAGQMSPAEFDNGIDYARRVANVVRGNRSTRSQTSRTVNQVVLALLGEAPFPEQVIGSRVAIVTVDSTTSVGPGAGLPGSASNGSLPQIPSPLTSGSPTNPNAVTSGSGQENRMDAYNRFQNNAAGLRR